jgi:hypothetical protein
MRQDVEDDDCGQSEILRGITNNKGPSARTAVIRAEV